MPIDNEVVNAVMYKSNETCNFLNKAIDKVSARYDQAIYAPSIDSIQVLATMAFVAFLLQSLMAIIDRTRMLPTVIQARKTNTKRRRDKKVWEAIQKYHSKKWEDKL